MKAKSVSTALWGEAMSMAVFILNRSPMKSVVGKTPYEVWHGKKLSISFLRTFGCVAQVKTVKPHLSKLEDKSTRMVFIGYEPGSKAYRLYDPVGKKVHVSRDVVFDEQASWEWSVASGGAGVASSSRTPAVFEFTMEQEEIAERGGADRATEDKEEPHTPMGGGAIPGSLVIATPLGSPVSAAVTPNSAQFVSPPADPSPNLDAAYAGEQLRFRPVRNLIDGAPIPGLAARNLGDQRLLMVSAEEPSSFSMAEQDPNWRKAMIEEMRSIEENCTWELVDPLANCRETRARAGGEEVAGSSHGCQISLPKRRASKRGLCAAAAGVRR